MKTTISFPLGQIVATTTAVSQLSLLDIVSGIARHSGGDWGDLDPEDEKANNEAIRIGERLLSAYHATNGTKFWVITERDRSYTTVLLPDDY